MELAAPAEAMLAYAEAAKRRPKDVSAWLNVAAAAEAAGSYGRAVLALKRATDLVPDDAAAWSRLGEVLLQLHRRTRKGEFLDEGIEAWQRSLRLDPTQQKLRDRLETYRMRTEQ